MGLLAQGNQAEYCRYGQLGVESSLAEAWSLEGAINFGGVAFSRLSHVDCSRSSPVLTVLLSNILICSHCRLPSAQPINSHNIFASATMSTSTSSTSTLSGSQVIALSLKNQGVTHIFGIVGIPVIEVAQACIDLGIRFISFRNEQAASYVCRPFVVDLG